MRRYRFGRFAAVVAAGYALLVVVLGVLALVSGDDSGLLRVVTFGVAWFGEEETGASSWPVSLALVLVGAGQGWVLWQVLRGRAAGDPVRSGRAVRWLRAALYLNVVCGLADAVPLPLPDWADDLVPAAAGLVLVVLFFLVLRGTSRGLRITALVAGVVAEAGWIAANVAGELDLHLVAQILHFARLDGVLWLVWMVLTLIAQARDGRWSRGTVWIGAAATALSYVLRPFAFDLPVEFPRGGLLLSAAFGLLGLLRVVWQARSAHELAGPPARAATTPALSPAPVRRPPGRWPLAALAVVLPLLPVAVNLAQGMPLWIGPRGVIESYLRESAGAPVPLSVWLLLDLFAGVGGMAVLVLAAVVRRTLSLVRATASALFLAIAAGVVSVLTAGPEPREEFWYPGPQIYPERDGSIVFGVSPLWHCAAFAVSALILIFQYGGGPAHRTRLHVVASAVAAAMALCFLPVADFAGGRVLGDDDCLAPEPYYGAHREPLKLSGEPAFACGVRGSETLPPVKDAPARVQIAYGRRLCEVFTRADPAEFARVARTDGVEVAGLASTLAHICPAASAVAAAESIEAESEYAIWAAEERLKCAATPRHRPKIEPVAAVVQPGSVSTDYGVLEVYEPDVAEGDPFLDELPYRGDVLAAGPGHLQVRVHSDTPLCVTTETYTRRPPVETKGWDEVVEAGLRSASGEIAFADPMGGEPLPDLAVRGKGHYRIRVHFAWRPWKGEERVTQQLLIMAYPGPGDEVEEHLPRRPGR
ncbi:hypothetical protein HNP84_008705 [Thermocatellispora tengchongensis]|uniref:Uncharacterized protein n=1 Tax=Thermocatellispora tengchongensis TaxID=1073253 RepID=A0A840PLT2_9ACTN|nr:hypothetical protein [Thermocatellispora tengchongensis]MBB5138943.1 hypothetical protein [Thermocatellispora tengchongensis]